MRNAPEPRIDRRWLAAVGFVGHVFGLWLVGHRLGPATTRANRRALAATVLAMAAGDVLCGARGVFVGWLIGHFAWSSYLARAVLHGEAGFASARPES